MKKSKIFTTILLVFSVIAFIYGLGMSMSEGKKRAHNLDSIRVSLEKLTPKETETGYRIYLDYKVENRTSVDLEGVYIDAVFFDQSGNQIGKVTSSFSPINLKKGETVTLQAYLTYKSSDDELFVTLYNNGLKDLTVSCEVTSATWGDGYWQY